MNPPGKYIFKVRNKDSGIRNHQFGTNEKNVEELLFLTA